MENISELWDQALTSIKEKVSKPSYDTWLKSTTAEAIENDTVIITSPNEFARDWLETHYAQLIKNTLHEMTGSALAIKFVTPDQQHENETSVHKEQKNEQTTESSHSNVVLNPDYTFDNFVIGSNNRFAHAASLAVAEAPANAYNPLFIYGGVGLGKTHIMNAIGHYVTKHNPDSEVVYIASEKFTNEFINSIRDNKGDEFRNKYRNVDVLLIDDIQFLAGKESTQEEFFHTFNALHDDSKQIVISSDRPPKEIPTLEDRLRSRFEWGLITDIAPPDLETRIAILRKKARAEGLDVPNDVMLYIANQINTNIRELEGALIRIIAYSSLINKDINVELAAEALKDLIPASSTKKITVNDIQQETANYFEINVEDMKAKKRTKQIATARQVAMYLSRDITDLSLPKIGQAFGGRDHTTVIHAYDKIEKQIKMDPELQNHVDTLVQKLKGSA